MKSPEISSKAAEGRKSRQEKVRSRSPDQHLGSKPLTISEMANQTLGNSIHERRNNSLVQSPVSVKNKSKSTIWHMRGQSRGNVKETKSSSATKDKGDYSKLHNSSSDHKPPTHSSAHGRVTSAFNIHNQRKGTNCITIYIVEDPIIFSANNSYIHNISINDPSILLKTIDSRSTTGTKEDKYKQVADDIQKYLKEGLAGHNSNEDETLERRHYIYKETMQRIIREDKYFGGVLAYIHEHYDKLLELRTSSYKREVLRGLEFKRVEERLNKQLQRATEEKQEVERAFRGRREEIERLKIQIEEYKMKVIEDNREEEIEGMKEELRVIKLEKRKLIEEGKSLKGENQELKIDCEQMKEIISKSELKQISLMNLLKGGKEEKKGNKLGSIKPNKLTMGANKPTRAVTPPSQSRREQVEIRKTPPLQFPSPHENCKDVFREAVVVPLLDLSKVRQQYKNAKIQIKEVTNMSFLKSEETGSDIDSHDSSPAVMNHNYRKKNEHFGPLKGIYIYIYILGFGNKKRAKKSGSSNTPTLDVAGILKRRQAIQMSKKFL